MSFNFHILGLFVIYLLMCMYFIHNNIKKNGNYLFRSLLVVNFISQFLYLLSFIFLNQSSDLFIRVVIIKLFIASLVIWPSILFGYVYSVSIKNKYLGRDTMYEKRVRFLSRILIVLDLVLVLFSFILPVSIRDIVVFGSAFQYAFFISYLFIILSFLALFLYNKSMESKDYLKLCISLFVSLVVLTIQCCFSKLGVLVSGYTFALLILYLTLESADARVIAYLKVAKDSAEKANASKMEFLEKLSREIRMPLNTIDGFSQVILDEEDIDNIREDVKDIRVASNNLVDLINGIMDISLIEAGKMEISNHEYDTMEMLDSVSMMAKTLINKKNIQFKVEYSDNIPKVMSGDSEKIKRILINLFRNAVQYTDKGEILFKVQAVNSGSICRLIMSVSDTGKGIKKEELNTIFNRYERVTGNHGSNGLGLAIVENLVNLLHGKVDVESEYGKGSTFTVTIDQKVVQEEGIQVTNHHEGKVDIFDASGMRVLVVDDNNLNLKVATKLLLPYKMEVVQASSGQEFLDIIDKDHSFDLILMDDMMPKMSGTETLAIFKKLERVDGYEIPVVVLTANAISGMRDKYLEAGFDDYLSKPIDKYELNRVLKKYFKIPTDKEEKSSYVDRVIDEEKSISHSSNVNLFRKRQRLSKIRIGRRFQ